MLIRFTRRAIVLLALVFVAYLVATWIFRPRLPEGGKGQAAATPTFKWPDWLKKPNVVSSGFVYVGTEEGRPLYRVVATELVGFEEGWFVLRGVRFSIFDAGGRSDSMEGEEARIHQGRGLAEVSGKVRFFGADGTVMHSDKLEIDTRRRTAKSPWRTDLLYGGIAARAGSAEVDTRGGRLTLSGGVFVETERPAPAPPLSGVADRATADRGTGTLELVGNVRVASLGSFLQGDRLELRQDGEGRLRSFSVEGTVRGTVSSAESSTGGDRSSHFGGSRLDGTVGETGDVERLLLDGGGTPALLFDRPSDDPPRQIEAAKIDASLSGGRLSTATAGGAVALVEFSDPPKRLFAAEVNASFAAGDGQPARIEASGGVRLEDGARRVSGERIVDVAKGDSLLEAAEGERASYEDDRFHMTAPRFAYRRSDEWVRADGDVRGRLLPDPKRAAAPMSDPGKPVFWSGRELEASNATGRAVLTGNARMWQEERLVKAEKITLDDRERVATCEKNVRAVMPDDPPAATAGQRPAAKRPPTIATGDRMIYREREQTGTLTGNAVVTSGDRKLTAGELTVCLDAQRKVQRIVGTGGVTIVDAAAGRRGAGEKLEYLVPEKRTILEGAPGKEAWVEERGGNRVGGAVLVVEGEGDRVRVRSAEGVRATSTTTPRTAAPPPQPR